MRRVKPVNRAAEADRLLMRRRIKRWLPRQKQRWAIAAVALAILVTPGLGHGGLGGVSSRLANLALAASGHLGLSVQNVQVQGRGMTPPADILRVIGVERGTPILSIHPVEARNQIEALPWVRSASVERLLPDTLRISLVERQPLALWQYRGKMALIDRDGVVVTTEKLERFAKLLLVVGQNAPAHAQDLLTLLARHPDLMRRIPSAVWVGDRRWALYFDNGVIADLPEADPDSAWDRLADIEQTHKVLARNIDHIDLRFPDRVVLHEIAAATPAPVKPAKKQMHAQARLHPIRQTVAERNERPGIRRARMDEPARLPALPGAGST